MMTRKMASLCVAGLALVMFPMAWGCGSAPTSGQSDPTTQALNDPMNYSPNMDHSDVTGNGNGFDSQGFKRDMDHVLNP